MSPKDLYAAATHDWPVTAAMLLYFWEAKIRFVSNDNPGTLVWFAYGAANIGFVWGYFEMLTLIKGHHP